MLVLKDSACSRWLLWAVIIGDGLFVVLQVPSPNFFGFGLTPFPPLAAETATYLLGGYVAWRLRAYSVRMLYPVCFALVVVLSAALLLADLPTGVVSALQMAVYAALALLNLCWGAVFASFKPSVSVVLVVGSYVVWSACALLFSFGGNSSGLSGLRALFPLASLVILGFCLARFDFGVQQKRYGDDEPQEGFVSLVVDVKESVFATAAFSFIFGVIMQMDVAQGASGYIVSPEAQIATIAVSVALLLYVLRDGTRVRFRVLALVPLALATVLMVRAVLAGQSFLANGLPLALFNFFGQLVWVVFAWKGYESKASSLCLFALGLGSMRLGLLLGRGAVEALSTTVGISNSTANLVSIVGLWALFIGVLAAVAVIVRRQNAETAPFGLGDAAREANAAAPVEAERREGEAGLYERRFAEAVEGAGLTERETEILALYAGGRSAVRIAEELFLSNYTVKTHLRRCYAKLGIHSRQELLDLVWKGQSPSA